MRHVTPLYVQAFPRSIDVNRSRTVLTERTVLLSLTASLPLVLASIAWADFQCQFCHTVGNTTICATRTCKDDEHCTGSWGWVDPAHGNDFWVTASCDKAGTGSGG